MNGEGDWEYEEIPLERVSRKYYIICKQFSQLFYFFLNCLNICSNLIKITYKLTSLNKP